MLHHWSRWQGHPDEHRFVTDEEARDWLLRNETEEEEIERVTGEVVEAERGPGQPRIGTPIKATLPDDVVAELDGLGGAYRQAVEAASEAHGRLIGAVIASRDLGPSEISRRSGLSRVTVTKALR